MSVLMVTGADAESPGRRERPRNLLGARASPCTAEDCAELVLLLAFVLLLLQVFVLLVIVSVGWCSCCWCSSVLLVLVLLLFVRVLLVLVLQVVSETKRNEAGIENGTK